MLVVFVFPVFGVHADVGPGLFPTARPILQVPLFAELEFGSFGRRFLLRLLLHRENLADPGLENRRTDEQTGKCA